MPIDIGNILAARASLEDQVFDLDLGEGQILRYRIPGQRDQSLRQAAMEAAFRREAGLLPTDQLNPNASYLCQVFALGGICLVGWSGIPGPDGKPLPDRDENGEYHSENGDKLLEIPEVGFKLSAALAARRKEAAEEAAEAKKALKPRSKTRRGKPRGQKSKAGERRTRPATATRKQPSKRSQGVQAETESSGS